MTVLGPAARVGALVGGKYRIVRLLAQGGMGVVYEAQHAVVRRRFAVKFLRRELAERRDILTRFHREAEAAGALESEHVAAAVDFGVAVDGAPYIVMEHLVGESLAALLAREGTLGVGRAADLVTQAARGIQVAHAAGIIHRDLKPQNLFVCRRETGTDLLKVLDFGVAKLQALDEVNPATGTGAMVGTVAYMSPEQARGDKIIDQRSDVYALGAILYELCAGRKPHPGDSANAILHHIATQQAVPLETVRPDLPAALVAIVAGALAADPAARPPSADALAEALAPFVAREIWPAPRLDEPDATAAAAAPGGWFSRRARRLVPLLIGAGLVALTLVGTRLLAPRPAVVHRAPSPLLAAPAPPLVRPAPPSPPPPSVAPAAVKLTAIPVSARPPLMTRRGARAGAVARTHPSRRHATATVLGPNVVTSPTAANADADAKSTSTAALPAPPVPVTFDQQNPYE